MRRIPRRAFAAPPGILLLSGPFLFFQLLLLLPGNLQNHVLLELVPVKPCQLELFGVNFGLNLRSVPEQLELSPFDLCSLLFGVPGLFNCFLADFLAFQSVLLKLGQELLLALDDLGLLGKDGLFLLVALPLAVRLCLEHFSELLNIALEDCLVLFPIFGLLRERIAQKQEHIILHFLRFKHRGQRVPLDQARLLHQLRNVIRPGHFLLINFNLLAQFVRVVQQRTEFLVLLGVLLCNLLHQLVFNFVLRRLKVQI